MSLPTLNQGLLSANRDAAISAARQAELDWRGAVLGAVEDVQAAQSAYARKQREVTALRSVVATNERVLTLARGSYEGGSSSLLDQLDAERVADVARLSLAGAT
ncbi:MAG: TolC family protein [Cypionkella sp.]